MKRPSRAVYSAFQLARSWADGRGRLVLVAWVLPDGRGANSRVLRAVRIGGSVRVHLRNKHVSVARELAIVVRRAADVTFHAADFSCRAVLARCHSHQRLILTERAGVTAVHHSPGLVPSNGARRTLYCAAACGGPVIGELPGLTAVAIDILVFGVCCAHHDHPSRCPQHRAQSGGRRPGPSSFQDLPGDTPITHLNHTYRRLLPIRG